MEVNLTVVNDNYQTVLINNRKWSLSSDGLTYWNKTDNYLKFGSGYNVAVITFAEPIRQFSMMLANDNGCVPGRTPYVGLYNSSGINAVGFLGSLPIDVGPPPRSVNQYRILRYRSSCPMVQSFSLVNCVFVMDNLKFKTAPCTPNPCNTTTEQCIDNGMDAVCCPMNTTWNGVKCLTGNPCIDLDTPCDPLATCTPLRTGNVRCTCPPKYIGQGTPGNCTLLESAPSNVTFNVVPILECIDQNNVAQFGYTSRERDTLLIDDSLRNNLEPINVAPVMVFSYGRSRRYPLNPGQVLLNVTSTEYIWRLENNNLSFAIETSRSCPTHISIVFQFSLSGTVNAAQFGEQTRSSFISVTNVDPSRVALVNVTEITSSNKRSVTQQEEMTQLEIEISLAAPENASQPSSAQVIRQFDPDQEDDLLYELNQAYPNQTISVSVLSTQAAPIVVPASPTSNPISSPLAAPTSSVVSLLLLVTFAACYLPLLCIALCNKSHFKLCSIFRSNVGYTGIQFTRYTFILFDTCHQVSPQKSKIYYLTQQRINMTTIINLVFLILIVACSGSGQPCTGGFDLDVEVAAPLDTITFDNLGSSVPWNSFSGGTALRITPATSMQVILTIVNDNYNYASVTNGLMPLSPDWSASWNKADNYLSYNSGRVVGTITFAEPVRQFSMILANDNGCVPSGWYPTISLFNSTGVYIGGTTVNFGPPPGSTNQYRILRYRSSCPVVQSFSLSNCMFAMDNLSFKTATCTPNPCNTTTEQCIDNGMDAVCCPMNTTWNGAKCLTGNPCIDLDNPCDPLATCTPLRTGSYTCTCPPKYIGNGTPSNCTLIESAPSNVTYNIVPILECIDQNNVAQFGYTSNETSVLLIDDPLRNNLEPVNVAPVDVFLPGRTRVYPLNPGQVLLNVTSTQYSWHLGNLRLNFTQSSALACPIRKTLTTPISITNNTVQIEINLILRFIINGTINIAQFGQQVRSAFIFATSVDPSRVILVNVTESSSVTKRSITQLDTTELEVELSVTPPPDNTQPSSADVIREFVSNQQDDMQYDINQANPNVTIKASVVTTKAIPIETPPIGAPMIEEPPMADEPTDSTPIQLEIPTNSFVTSGAPMTQQAVLCLLIVLTSTILL